MLKLFQNNIRCCFLPLWLMAPLMFFSLVVRAEDADEKTIPTITAVSVGFEDKDPTGGEIAGDVVISAAYDEQEISAYALYWGNSKVHKLRSSPIPITILKKGQVLSYNFAENTPIPVNATHLLVFTRNQGEEMPSGIGVAIDDLGGPIQPATEVQFVDDDPDGGQVAGTVVIVPADIENGLTHYGLYWGQDAQNKIARNPEIASIPKEGFYDVLVKQPLPSSNLAYRFRENTEVPLGATHLLVFTQYQGREMSTGMSVPIQDWGLPVQMAKEAVFINKPTKKEGRLQGTLRIVTDPPAADKKAETTVNYALYWADEHGQKLGSPIDTIETTLEHDYIFEETSPLIPPEASHLLVVRRHKQYWFQQQTAVEMAKGKLVPLAFEGLPEGEGAQASIQFQDADLDEGRIGGTVTITSATQEQTYNITHYRLYWGDAELKKLPGYSPIAQVKVVAGKPVYVIPEHTAIPENAKYLLIFSKNAIGESLERGSLPIEDRPVRPDEEVVTKQTVARWRLARPHQFGVGMGFGSYNDFFIFHDYSLSAQGQLHTQFSQVPERRRESAGSDIIRFRRSLISMTYRHYFGELASGSFYAGGGLGFGQTNINYEATEVRLESDLKTSTFNLIRTDYKLNAKSNGFLALGELGWKGHWDQVHFHLGYQAGAYLTHNNNYDETKVSGFKADDIVNHREYIEDSRKKIKDLNSLTLGIGWAF